MHDTDPIQASSANPLDVDSTLTSNEGDGKTTETAPEWAASTICRQLVVEQAHLTDGIPCMWLDQGSKVRLAYDPQQIDENAAKAVVILKVGDARRRQLAAKA